MADVPKFPGFPGQPGDAWAFIKNIPSFLGGEDAEVDTSMLPFDLGDKRLIESNEPFMPPDLTTVDPTDKYSQLERDWQNLQKIPEGTRDIFNRIVSEGEPASIWPVQELFPHIEPRSSNPIRSVNPLTSPPRNLTVEKMIRAIEPGMRGPSGPPPTRIPSWRPFLRGGPLALGVASSLFSPRAEAPMKTPRRVYEDVTNPLHMSPVYFTDEDSPFRKQLPHSLFPPGYLRERAGRNAVEGVRQNLLGNLGLLPSTTSGALTPQELFKQRNDAEELRLREGSLPVIPETSIWNPISAAGASAVPASPDVIFNPPPVVPRISREQEIENMMIRDRMENLKYLPGHPLYEAPFEAGTGPMAGAVIPQVETFTEPRTSWTPPATPAPAITEALESFTAARDTGEEQRNREQDQRERALEQAADDRRESEQQERIATARNKTAEKKRVAKENKERKAEEQRIATKQAKEKKQRRATESQMESMLKQMNETRQIYLDRKAKEEDRRRRAGYGVGAMYT